MDGDTKASLNETQKIADSPEKLDRTLFIGNVPISIAKERRLQRSFRQVFENVGPIESIRFRSIVGEKATPKRVAFITGKTADNQKSCNSFIVMMEKSDAIKATQSLNGTLFEGHHLRVDLASNSNQKPATKKSVFIGNLPLTVSDDSLWKLFEPCGQILYVRIIRDSTTGLAKGFGYVAFKEKAAVELALQLNGADCDGRPMRISKCAKPGYQKTKKARIEKRDQAKGYNKGSVKPKPIRHELEKLPKLVAKHEPKVIPVIKAKHPAEIRKERKQKKNPLC